MHPPSQPGQPGSVFYQPPLGAPAGFGASGQQPGYPPQGYPPQGFGAPAAFPAGPSHGAQPHLLGQAAASSTFHDDSGKYKLVLQGAFVAGTPLLYVWGGGGCGGVRTR